ncbi:MAG: hypothetical protein AAGM38_17585 [Pseudomonadota bacterium]
MRRGGETTCSAARRVRRDRRLSSALSSVILRVSGWEGEMSVAQSRLRLASAALEPCRKEGAVLAHLLADLMLDAP